MSYGSLQLAVLGFGAHNYGLHQLDWSPSWLPRFYTYFFSQMKVALDLMWLLRHYLDLLRPPILSCNLTAVYNYGAWITYWIVGEGCGQWKITSLKHSYLTFERTLYFHNGPLNQNTINMYNYRIYVNIGSSCLHERQAQNGQLGTVLVFICCA